MIARALEQVSLSGLALMILDIHGEINHRGLCLRDFALKPSLRANPPPHLMPIALYSSFIILHYPLFCSAARILLIFYIPLLGLLQVSYI